MINKIKKSLLFILLLGAFQLSAQPEQFKEEVKKFIQEVKSFESVDQKKTLCAFLINVSLFNIHLTKYKKLPFDEKILAKRYTYLINKNNNNIDTNHPREQIESMLAKLMNEESLCLVKDTLQEQSECALALNQFIHDEFTSLQESL